MISSLTIPSMFPFILSFEIVLIWWHWAFDSFSNPVRLVLRRTSNGNTFVVFEVIGTTVTVSAALLLALLLTISTGRIFLISEPTVGFKLAKYISPRFI